MLARAGWLVIVTTQYDHSQGKWRFTIQRIKHDIPEWISHAKYTTDIDAYEAGKDAINFDLYYRTMEAGS